MSTKYKGGQLRVAFMIMTGMRGIIYGSKPHSSIIMRDDATRLKQAEEKRLRKLAKNRPTNTNNLIKEK